MKITQGIIGMAMLIIAAIQGQAQTDGTQTGTNQNVVEAAVQRRKAAEGQTAGSSTSPAASPTGSEGPAASSLSGIGFSAMGESGGSDDPASGPCPGFVQQVFSVVDTNAAASNDTNLYNELLSFPTNTNTGPELQIMLYQTNIVLIRANHFDYSADTRDFALVICDSVLIPLWKNINLSNTTNVQDGWLIQGLVPNFQVTDPMYLMVSNISLSCDAFFRAIPYSGPQITLAGANPNDTVSNTITLQAAIVDLSGTANQTFGIEVAGLSANYSLAASNTISIDTSYFPNGNEDVSLLVGNTNALLYDPTSSATDTKLNYATSADIPFDFEHSSYVISAGDMCTPDVGTNYFVFGINNAEHIQATISDPSNGHIVMAYSNYFPSAATVAIPWNFTESNGITPYSNDTYVVTVVMSDPDTFTLANAIDRTRVRTAAGSILQYEDEDPTTSAGAIVDSESASWGGAISFLYTSLYDYDFGSTSQYYPSQIGYGRDNPYSPVMPFELSANTQTGWVSWLQGVCTNPVFSDFNYGPGHANNDLIGGGQWRYSWQNYVNATISGPQVQAWLLAGAQGARNNWRVRKAAMWACYTANNVNPGNNTFSSPAWPPKLGIKPTLVQLKTSSYKNVGMFFTSKLDFAPYGSSQVSISEVAAVFEQLWAYGPSPYPGGCDPTWAFGWAVAKLESFYPELVSKAGALPIGYPFVPFTGNFDSELSTNNTGDVNY